MTPTGYLNPFRLDTTHGVTLDGDAINDPAHQWGPQHQAWHDGAMGPVGHRAHRGQWGG